MSRLLIFVGMIVGGWAGWWLGDYFNLGLLWAFVLSTLGSLVGVYAGWKVGEDYFGD